MKFESQKKKQNMSFFSIMSEAQDNAGSQNLLVLKVQQSKSFL